jgi:putative tryptophan/tyrosine transport system substrate-binding protein
MRRRSRQMKRREFAILLAGTAAAWPLSGRAQQKAMPAIGLLHLAPGDPTDTFRHYMQRDGWETQHNLRLLVVSSEGDRDRVVAAARELASQNPDVIIVFGDPATRAVQQATSSIPIVAMTDDMLGSGLIASMARPGGNTTGISIFASELDVKRLELLHEAVPQAARIGILADTSTISTRPQLEMVAGRLGIDLVIRSGATPDEVGRAAEQFTGTGVDAVNVLASPVTATAHKTIIDRLNRAGLPAIYQWPEYAEAGGLLGYGPSFPDCYRQVAALAGKILKGAKPGELPVEQPTKFELAINLKTARALSLTLPPSLLGRAADLIE